MKTFVVNGYPHSGKDTFVSYCKNLLEKYGIPTYDFSTITPVKLVARQFGWNGQKDNASRKMLADIQSALISYNNYPFNYIKNSIHDMESANRPLGLDIQIKSLGISLTDDNGLFKPLSQILYELKKIQNSKDKIKEVQQLEKEIDLYLKKEGRYKNCKESVFFIYCREPDEIQKYVDFFNATTVLITRKIANTANFSNNADKMVMNYHYDYIIENNESLDVLRTSAETFLKEFKII